MEERPEIIILPGRGAIQLVEFVENLLKTATEGKDSAPHTRTLLGMSSEFKPNGLLSSFPLEADVVNDNLPSVTLPFRSILTLKISAAASIIVTLKKNQSVTVLPSHITWFSMSPHMAISNDSLLALLVINEESHPNMHLKKMGGLSLLGN
jgi:hypothetical protein